MSSEIFYIDEDNNKELCFMHAVQVVIMRHKPIRSEIEEQDPDQSAMMRIHDCYMCN